MLLSLGEPAPAGNDGHPNKTEGRGPECPAVAKSLSVVPTRVTAFLEYPMKKVIAILVLALSVATVVGCGSSSPSTGGGSKATTK